MSGSRVLSNRTLAVLGALFAMIVAIAWVVISGIGGETVGLWVADVGSTVVSSAAAAVVLLTARRYRAGEPYRRYWTLIGAGILVYAVGDLIWAFYELGSGDVPYPGLPDVFYFAEYVFLGAALVLAAMGYRALLDVRTPSIIAVTVCVVLAAGLWFGYLGPTVAADPGIPLIEKLVSIGYPMADVFIALGPALLLFLLTRQLAGGRLGWPWLPVVLGAVMLAASDTGYALAEATGSYATGGVLEYGWMLAHVLLAFGALIGRDVTDSFAAPD